MSDTDESNHMHYVHVIHSTFSILNFLSALAELVTVQVQREQEDWRHPGQGSPQYFKKSGICIQILELLKLWETSEPSADLQKQGQETRLRSKVIPSEAQKQHKVPFTSWSPPFSLNHEYCTLQISLLNGNIPKHLGRNEVPIPWCIWSGYSR